MSTTTTSKNSNLHGAKRAKNDEFYTQLTDVEKELKHYRPHFRDKVVYCNCDDPTKSAFWIYFSMNFEFLGLKRLIATHYTGIRGGIAYALEMTPESQYHSCSGPDCVDCTYTYTPLAGDGDFRSDESIALLEQSDIVVTNPPFSLFREYVAQLVKYGKKFVIMGNKNAITYKEIFPLIRDDKMWAGYGTINGGRWMILPNGVEATSDKVKITDDGQRILNVAGVCWFTNLDHVRRHEVLELTKRYTPEKYPKYDNYDAINCDKVYDIPLDYTETLSLTSDEVEAKRAQGFVVVPSSHPAGQLFTILNPAIGVPVTFLDKWNPDQYEMLGISADLALPIARFAEPESYQKGGPRFYLSNGDGTHRRIYDRLVIRQVATAQTS